MNTLQILKAQSKAHQLKRSNHILNFGAAYHLAYVVFHAFFWKIQDWPQALRDLTELDQQIMQILNLCLIFIFVGFAYISFAHKKELMFGKLGRTLLFFIAFFWFFRIIEHFYFNGIDMDSVLFSMIFIPGFLAYFYLGIRSSKITDNVGKET